MIIVKICGGLGNQMFEYALVRWLESLGKEVKIDASVYHRKLHGLADVIHNGYELKNIFDIDAKPATISEIQKCSRYTPYVYARAMNRLFGHKKSHITREQLGKDRWFFPQLKEYDHVYLDGYWCTFKYADEIKEDILKQFTFSQLSDEKNMETMQMIRKSNSVCLHVRHGDYLKLQDRYVILDESYYKKAMEMIEGRVKDPVFFCFSDDIAWCKKHITAQKIFFVDWNQGNNSFRDMQLMSCCQHNIIANSTFSMWAAWLNQNQDKVIICPKSIFVDGKNMPIDMYPTEWIKI